MPKSPLQLLQLPLGSVLPDAIPSLPCAPLPEWPPERRRRMRNSRDTQEGKMLKKQTESLLCKGHNGAILYSIYYSSFKIWWISVVGEEELKLQSSPTKPLRLRRHCLNSSGKIFIRLDLVSITLPESSNWYRPRRWGRRLPNWYSIEFGIRACPAVCARRD